MNPIQIRAVKTFEQARDKIDHNLEEIKNFLEAQHVGYRGKLVDNEGYPLPNVDHYRVAEERQHAARLLNDRIRIEYVLEKLVETQYNPEIDKTVPLYMALQNLKPFAVVNEVFPKSPAEESQLEVGDIILSIGNATNMVNVPSEIKADTKIDFKVFRVDKTGMNMMTIPVTPHEWSGKGLIGAHLLPFHD